MAPVPSSPARYPRRGPPDADQPHAVRVVAMRGEYDPSTVDALSETFSAAMAVDDTDLVVDASEVRFLDASTLGVMIRAQKLLREASHSLLVRSPSACVRRLCKICDLDSLIEDRNTSGDALIGGSLETWVAVPASIPEHHPWLASTDETASTGTVRRSHPRRTPPLALIGLPPAPSVEGVVEQTRPDG